MKDICEASRTEPRRFIYALWKYRTDFADIINEFMSGLENDIAEKMENGQSATVILDELLERYQSGNA